MKALNAGQPEVVAASEIPMDAKHAETYPLLPELEQAMKDIRAMLWTIQIHPAGIASLTVRIKEHDGAFADYRQTYGRPKQAKAKPKTNRTRTAQEGARLL